MEKQEADVSRKLTSTINTNSKLTRKITELNEEHPSKQKRQKRSVTIQTPADEKRARSSGPRQEKSNASSGFIYVRKDRKQDGGVVAPEKEQKTKKKRDANPKSPCPPIFSEKDDSSEEITKMRQAVNKVWNRIEELEAAIADAKAMTLAED